MARLGIVFGKEGDLLSDLCKFFTGSRAYHTFWVTEDYIYDMWLLRRRRNKTKYDGMDCMYFDFPKVTQDYLEARLTSSDTEYGFIDYVLFAFRPVYHFFGQPTRNAGGEICSEMTNNDLLSCGEFTLWRSEDAPPSPGDFVRWLSPDQYR